MTSGYVRGQGRGASGCVRGWGRGASGSRPKQRRRQPRGRGRGAAGCGRGQGRQGVHEVEGGRRSASSETSSSTSSSRSGTRVKGTLERRRMQVQEGDGERDDDATTAANDEGNGEDGADDDQDGDTAAESRPGIQARLRKAPGVIMADTGDHRPQRTRATTNIYQAGTKTEVKKQGRGRGRQ